MDSYDDVTRMVDGAVLSPCQRLSLDDTPQDCTLTSLTGNDEIVSQRQKICNGTQTSEGAGFYSTFPCKCYSDDESELTLRSPEEVVLALSEGATSRWRPVYRTAQLTYWSIRVLRWTA